MILSQICKHKKNNWQLPSPPLTERLSFWLRCFSCTGYFQFFDFMPYLPSPIKIKGKATKRQAYNFKQELTGARGRGLKRKRRRLFLFPWLQPLSFKSPSVSKQRHKLLSAWAAVLPSSVCDMCSHSILMEPKARFLMQTLVLGPGFLQLTWL